MDISFNDISIRWQVALCVRGRRCCLSGTLMLRPVRPSRARPSATRLCPALCYCISYRDIFITHLFLVSLSLSNRVNARGLLIVVIRLITMKERYVELRSRVALHDLFAAEVLKDNVLFPCLHLNTYILKTFIFACIVHNKTFFVTILDLEYLYFYFYS